MTLQQVADLREEGEALYGLLDTLTDEQWAMPTPFKNRTVNWVVRHLHDADRWAVLSITDPDAYRGWAVKWIAGRRAYPSYPRGRPLLERWRADFLKLCDTLDASDPAVRIPWFGPDMSIRMMATARQMETWAHGQDVYDLVRVRRRNTDRIRNICVLGVRTYGWTFLNRELDVPAPEPYVRLDAPSGAVWEWNDPSDTNCVMGSAVEFAHVVTQGRNIADCNLTVVGETANAWMRMAQCFAGEPQEPPAPGERAW